MGVTVERITSVPHVCLKCKEEGNQYGRLVFSNEPEVPQCRYHKVPLTPVAK